MGRCSGSLVAHFVVNSLLQLNSEIVLYFIEGRCLEVLVGLKTMSASSTEATKSVLLFQRLFISEYFINVSDICEALYIC